LTVTEFDASSFKVGVAPETLRKTNLGKHIFFSLFTFFLPPFPLAQNWSILPPHHHPRAMSTLSNPIS